MKEKNRLEKELLESGKIQQSIFQEVTQKMVQEFHAR